MKNENSIQLEKKSGKQEKTVIDKQQKHYLGHQMSLEEVSTIVAEEKIKISKEIVVRRGKSEEEEKPYIGF